MLVINLDPGASHGAMHDGKADRASVWLNGNTQKFHIMGKI